MVMDLQTQLSLLIIERDILEEEIDYFCKERLPIPGHLMVNGRIVKAKIKYLEKRIEDV